MPKIKSHGGAKKRFGFTKNGKIKRAHAFKSHLLNTKRKSTKRKRHLRAGGTINSKQVTANLKELIPYK